MNILKLFKLLGGTQQVKVPASSEHKAYTRTQKKASGRLGTGKLTKFPKSIKDKILELRKIGYSGAQIKTNIESLITISSVATGEIKEKLDNAESQLIFLSQEKGKKITDERRNYLNDKLNKVKVEIHNLRSQATGEEKTHIDGKPIDRDLIKEGIINNKGKLTVTAQALTDWAKKQGVESSKKRVSGAQKEKESHDSTKKELDRSNQKIAQLEVAAKHNLEEIKLVQQSKMKSDRIRQDLGKDNLNLKDKLKECLRGNK